MQAAPPGWLPDARRKLEALIREARRRQRRRWLAAGAALLMSLAGVAAAVVGGGGLTGRGAPLRPGEANDRLLQRRGSDRLVSSWDGRVVNRCSVVPPPPRPCRPRGAGPGWIVSPARRGG
jgi:hypothetical protein